MPAEREQEKGDGSTLALEVGTDSLETLQI